MIIRSAFGIDLVEGGPSWIGARTNSRLRRRQKIQRPLCGIRCPKSTVHYFGRLFLIDQLPARKTAVYVFLEMIALGFALEAVAAFFSFRFALMFSTKHFGQKPT